MFEQRRVVLILLLSKYSTKSVAVQLLMELTTHVILTTSRSRVQHSVFEEPQDAADNRPPETRDLFISEVDVRLSLCVSSTGSAFVFSHTQARGFSSSWINSLSLSCLNTCVYDGRKNLNLFPGNTRCVKNCRSCCCCV